MSQIVCLRHPLYRGTTQPDLSCKTCCTRYIAKIRDGRPEVEREFDAYEWIENKTKDRRRAFSVIGGRFDPSTI